MNFWQRKVSSEFGMLVANIAVANSASSETGCYPWLTSAPTPWALISGCKSYVATLGEGTMNLVSPSNCFSTPPLKKNVTWAYFSVSDKKKNQSGSQLLGRVVKQEWTPKTWKHQVKILKLKTVIKKHFLWCLRIKFCLFVLLCSKTSCLPVSAQFLSNLDMKTWMNSLYTVHLWNQDYHVI